MKHQLKGALTLLAGVTTTLGLLGGAASLADHCRETRAYTLLAESIVAAALATDVGTR